VRAQAAAIAGKFNVAWVAVCVDALGEAWPDKALPLRYLIGFSILFDIPDSGVYKEDLQPAEISERDFVRNNTRMVAQISSAKSKPNLRKRARSNPSGASSAGFGRKKKLTMASSRSRALGRTSTKSTVAVSGDASGARPFSRKASGAASKRNKMNKATRMRERLVTSRADLPVTVAREFAARTSIKKWRKRNVRRCAPVYGALGKACLQPIMQREYDKVA
jgi:hypothetical protein